jgi:hypothetical protein
VEYMPNEMTTQQVPEVLAYAPYLPSEVEMEVVANPSRLYPAARYAGEMVVEAAAGPAERLMPGDILRNAFQERTAAAFNQDTEVSQEALEAREALAGVVGDALEMNRYVNGAHRAIAQQLKKGEIDRPQHDQLAILAVAEAAYTKGRGKVEQFVGSMNQQAAKRGMQPVTSVDSLYGAVAGALGFESTEAMDIEVMKVKQSALGEKERAVAKERLAKRTSAEYAQQVSAAAYAEQHAYAQRLIDETINTREDDDDDDDDIIVLPDRRRIHKTSKKPVTA